MYAYLKFWSIGVLPVGYCVPLTRPHLFFFFLSTPLLTGISIGFLFLFFKIYAFLLAFNLFHIFAF